MKEICMIVLDLERKTPLAEIRVKKNECIAMIAGINIQQGFQSLVLQNLVGEFVHNIIMKVQADGVENECHHLMSGSCMIRGQCLALRIMPLFNR